MTWRQWRWIRNNFFGLPPPPSYLTYSELDTNIMVHYRKYKKDRLIAPTHSLHPISDLSHINFSMHQPLQCHQVHYSLYLYISINNQFVMIYAYRNQPVIRNVPRRKLLSNIQYYKSIAEWQFSNSEIFRYANLLTRMKILFPGNEKNEKLYSRYYLIISISCSPPTFQLLTIDSSFLDYFPDLYKVNGYLYKI